jgi:hypothetical protein
MTQLDCPTAKVAPAVRFDHPQRLLDDASLSVTEKRDLLDEWEDDLRAQLVASEEGMTGPDGVPLADVLKAKQTLPIDAPPRPSDAKA